MEIDGEKIRRLREEAGMTQDKLALMSRVNERTIQRAEAGATLSAETVAQIAAALGKQPRDIRKVAAPGSPIDDDVDSNEPNRVVLHATMSAKDVLALFAGSYEADIGCEVEPDEENVELLAAFANTLYRLAPDPLPESGPEDPNAYSNGESPLARRLKTTAALNKELAVMADAGIRLFIGSYMKMVTIPAYSMDDGGWFTDSTMEPEPMRIAVLRIDTQAKDRIVIWARDAVAAEAQRNTNPGVPHFNIDLDDELPF